MISPKKNDFVDIHTHDGSVIPEVFKIKCLMAHLREYPHEYPDIACSVGAHPWYLKEENLLQDLGHVSIVATGENILAIGEIGLDKAKDVDMSLQIKAFEIQAKMAEKLRKPVIVHCVKAWDELLKVTDILIDGPFILEQKDWEIKFRGSSNQRYIDCQESIKQGRAVETDP